METVKQLLEFLLNPFFLGLLLLLITLVLSFKAKFFRFFQLNLFIVVTFLVLSTGFVPYYLTSFLESKYSRIDKVNPNIKLVVVLGGGQGIIHGAPVNQLLTSASIKRLLEGARLFKNLAHAQLILSGGANHSSISEAALMYQLCDMLAISKKNIVLEPNSLNTKDQAQEMQKRIGSKSFYLVTSASHMPRAMALFKKYGLNPIAAPTDFTFYWSTNTWVKMLVPNPYNLTYFTIAFHELLGRLAYLN